MDLLVDNYEELKDELLNAMKSKSPKTIENALKDFEKMPKDGTQKEEANSLKALARNQMDGLKKKDSMHNSENNN